MNTIMEDEDSMTLASTSAMGEPGRFDVGPIGCPSSKDSTEGFAVFTRGLITHNLHRNEKGLQKLPASHHAGRWSDCYTTEKGFLKDSRGRNIASSNLSNKRTYCSVNNTNNNYWGLTWPLPRRTLWVCCLWVLFTTPTNTCADSNGCDFYGSGLEQDGRGVQPVYLSCTSGRVEWQYPRAGLRVILKSPHKDKDFHACIKADSKFEGARIYLEGHRSLLPLFATDDDRPSELIRCFTSYKGQAALYVEADTGSDDLKKQVAAFEYDLQSLSKGAVYDPLEECRPCSEEELLHLYCSADFVAKGTIIGVEDDSRLSRTIITVKASKLFQQTSPVFRHSGKALKNLKSSSGSSHLTRRDAELISNSLTEGEEFGYLGRLDMPLECGARAGDGEFLVMGIIRLGQPVLRCAPRHSDWLKLAKTAYPRVQCVIET